MEDPKLPEKTFVPNDHVREEDKHQPDAKTVHVLVTHMSSQCVCKTVCMCGRGRQELFGLSGGWRCIGIN